MQGKPPPAPDNGDDRRDVRPYEQLAELYDYVMRHVNYVEWADYVDRVFQTFDSNPRRIFEAACGTGTLALELTKRGYSVNGVDRSAQMIGIAWSKADGVENGPTFSAADMRHLPEGDWDAVLCLYDSVNYCLTVDDLRDTLAGLRRCVVEGALGVIDVTTETNSLLYFSDYESSERWRGYRYTRHSKYVRQERLQVNEFRIQHRDRDEVIVERHEQRIYDVDEVLAAVDAGRWEILGAFDDFTFDVADSTSERIHIVLRAR